VRWLSRGTSAACLRDNSPEQSHKVASARMGLVNNASEKFAAKVPLQLECSQCKEPASVKIHLDATTFDWTCHKCGFHHPSFLGLDVTIGFLILGRSRYELCIERDFSMAIVMAAMAFDSELSRLFGKWKQIDTGKAGKVFDREECERELRDFKTINRKIDEVSKLLVGKGVDDFVSSCAELYETISIRFKSIRIGSLPEDFQRQLFWPRNKVLHWGDAKNSYEDAARCWSIANLGLLILRRMDEERRKHP
jgi:hypothetical protein